MNRVENTFLTDTLKGKKMVFIYLITGIRFSGYLLAFDKDTLVLTSHATSSNCQLIYRQAISTIQVA
jgi:RNA chaperone Hfq